MLSLQSKEVGKQAILIKIVTHSSSTAAKISLLFAMSTLMNRILRFSPDSSGTVWWSFSSNLIAEQLINELFLRII